MFRQHFRHIYGNLLLIFFQVVILCCLFRQNILCLQNCNICQLSNPKCSLNTVQVLCFLLIMYCYSSSINVWKINLESKKVSMCPMQIIAVRKVLMHLCVWEAGRSRAFKYFVKYALWKLYWTLTFLDTIFMEAIL